MSTSTQLCRQPDPASELDKQLRLQCWRDASVYNARKVGRSALSKFTAEISRCEPRCLRLVLHASVLDRVTNGIFVHEHELNLGAEVGEEKLIICDDPEALLTEEMRLSDNASCTISNAIPQDSIQTTERFVDDVYSTVHDIKLWAGQPRLLSQKAVNKLILEIST
jgi:hypothetical protein